MARYCVYAIWNKANGKAYVGKTGDLNSRWSHHKSLARAGDEAALYRAMRKYGVELFKVTILERCRDETHAFARERVWIASLNTFGPRGYNMSEGGEGQSGFKHPEASKPMMAMRGERNGCYGRVWTAEERAAHAERTLKQFAEHGHPFTGRTHSAETRAKISASAKGHKRHVGMKRSPETCARISEALKGKPAWNKGRKGLTVTSDAVRAKQSDAQRARWAALSKEERGALLPNFAGWNKGKELPRQSQETCEKRRALAAQLTVEERAERTRKAREALRRKREVRDGIHRD